MDDKDVLKRVKLSEKLQLPFSVNASKVLVVKKKAGVPYAEEQG